MTHQNFEQLLQQGMIILDGAMGTKLFEMGMPNGVCPEEWILQHIEGVKELQRSYVENGSQIIYAPTFGANPLKLEDYGLEKQMHQMNLDLVKLSKDAAGDRALVAGCIAPTGKISDQQPRPFEEIVDCYKAQVRALEEGGVDLYIVETMFSLQEARAAVLAIKETSSKPFMVTMTFDENGKTFYGTDPLSALVTLQSLGANAIGFNCSTGPDRMIELVKTIKPYAKVPIITKPNAGLPEVIDGQTRYNMDTKTFVSYCKELALAGAHIIGGCCGTDPGYIKKLSEQMADFSPLPIKGCDALLLCSERKSITLTHQDPTVIIGEQINPTGKPQLKQALKSKQFDYVAHLAKDQIAHGAALLDVNVGMDGIDEKEVMQEVIQTLTTAVDTPLCIDSSSVDVLEAALRQYPGRALINSISFEKEKINRLLPIAAKYGAAFIMLPLSEHGIPDTLEDKKSLIGEIYTAALKHGYSKSDILIDGLVTTIATKESAATELIQTIRYINEELEMMSVVGLSNISFGLPNRETLNSVFLTMLIQSGLTCAIANPSSEPLMHAVHASNLLLQTDTSSYIQSHSKSLKEEQAKEHIIYQSVLQGKRGKITQQIDEAIKEGIKPQMIAESFLIPAIEKVGELFDQQIYFLPQLIISAETMKKGLNHLQPLLAADNVKDNDSSKETIIMATVKGDVHDIGKNLVTLMLRNYGYNVIDLGKDVSCDAIIEAAISNQAKIIGLSALMTTTMTQMVDVVEKVKECGLDVKVIVGGAVVTQSFATKIGADGYSKDAREAVKLVQSLLN